MLGITLHLGASKDQIIDSKTREVVIDRYMLRNYVKRVQEYKPGDNTEKPCTKYPIGMQYVAYPLMGPVKAAEELIRQHARKAA